MSHCVCPFCLLVASCVAVVGWCCRERVHITFIVFVGCLLNMIVFELDYNLYFFIFSQLFELFS